MTTNPPSQHPARHPIGIAHGVTFDVVAWGPAMADVDLSVACMFEHEVGGAPIAGGLLALDQALGGRLMRLRASGTFRAQAMETLLITAPSAALAPRAVLVIGLGDPGELTSDVLRRATRVAMREAIRHGARSMAFAPSVLDAGHTDNAALNMPEVMLDGMLGALSADMLLADTGLATAPVLRHCTFDVGAARVESAALAFATAFAKLHDDK
ncbi:M17 family peptidase N-terminal domain-containing protein [Janthinobacterium psychrotolerans]|uniref:Cytosol aminopeptidase family, N-terminal domain n=1 Tax=Janthinobacterium psychrotolerans TaxID=1747903 RepID=A0A1A7BZK1_9BURK|nr:M17 family peptidase N-terminal domain-containing protein [Janthinobacterium psychrotolerans]OBV38927.1 Cytosol aminopeptidase family, N-terminal domain [Janthinobacterium psychrotolerans]